MKTKTLAALLLAAVMVTPSYGAELSFLLGADNALKFEADQVHFATGYFHGVCHTMNDTGLINLPSGGKYGQLIKVVARYVDNHPEHHHLHETELVKRACKEAWPDLNKHVVISK